MTVSHWPLTHIMSTMPRMFPRIDSRAPMLAAALLAAAATTTGSCRQVAGIPDQPPACTSALMIDDMEDGRGDLCRTSGRRGGWFTVGDGSSADLTPVERAEFKPTLIPGGRGQSRYAARVKGSGFTQWGALMGLNLKAEELGRQPYDASGVAGIKFWVKSDVPLLVDFLIPQTIAPIDGGACMDTATKTNCNNHFSFWISTTSAGWTEFQIPFSALRQKDGASGVRVPSPLTLGSATWNPGELVGIQFVAPPGAPFDVWVDDVSFYQGCPAGGCVPTCADPISPLACPAIGPSPAACRQPGIDCTAAAGWCSDPLMIDDMEDGEPLICDQGGRHGQWFAVVDEAVTDFEPGKDFRPTLIPGGRGASRYAARIKATGHTSWSARMGLYLPPAGPQIPQPTYNASAFSGIKFWLKSSGPLSVDLHLAESTPLDGSGGTCDRSAVIPHCYSILQAYYGATGGRWVEYELPFTALSRTARYADADGNLIAGRAWDPTRLLRIEFSALSADFDLWVDDLRFYSCGASACLPTCDANAPLACPASGGLPASCWPAGSDCSHLPRPVEHLGVWGSGRNDVWAVGVSSTEFVSDTDFAGSIRRWTGSAWSSVGRAPSLYSNAVWGSGPADVWAVGGRGTIRRWDGIDWLTVPSGVKANLIAVGGSGPGDAWAVGWAGTVLRLVGSTWTQVPSNSNQTLWGVWGRSSDDAWAVGDEGAIIRWNGSVWSPVASGTTAYLYGVWGSDDDDVWAVGERVLHWDGSHWAEVPTGVNANFYGAWGSGRDDVWAVGDVGTIVHWNGSTWAPVISGTSNFLTAVWGSGPDNVWAVGDADTLLHYDGRAWSSVGADGTLP